MQDDLRKFSQNVLSGIQGANTSAGTGNPIVDNFTRSAFGDILTNAGAGMGNMASATAQREEQEAEAARRARVKELEDKMDPSKYSMYRRDDGGFGFLDPQGNEIEISRYAEVTGQNPAQILRDSDNPFDRQFLNDYQNVGNLITAIQNGDQEVVQQFTRDNGEVGDMKPEDLMRELIRRYPHIYGNGNYWDSYKNNNNPLLRTPTGGSGMAAGGSSAGGSTGISTADYGW